MISGSKHSEETKKKISYAKKGSIPWNKDLKLKIPVWNKGMNKEEYKSHFKNGFKGAVIENKYGSNHPRWTGGDKETKCDECKKIIFRKKCEFKRHKNLFCSKECLGKYKSKNFFGKNSPSWNGGKIEVICFECGSKIFRNKFRIEHTKNLFCSKECLNKYQRENPEKLCTWVGGKSFEPYEFNFNREFKRKIRKRDNQVCMLCGVHREKIKRALSIHHVNYNKLLTIQENCISLCESCHGKTNHNREYWIKFFHSILHERYNYNYTELNEPIIEITKEQTI